MYTAEEVALITREKLIRLQSLYIDQFKRLQHLLKEKKRRYLHNRKVEHESIGKTDGVESIEMTGGVESIGKTGGVESIGKTGGVESIGRTGGVESIGRTEGVESIEMTGGHGDVHLN